MAQVQIEVTFDEGEDFTEIAKRLGTTNTNAVLDALAALFHSQTSVGFQGPNEQGRVKLYCFAPIDDAKQKLRDSEELQREWEVYCQRKRWPVT